MDLSLTDEQVAQLTSSERLVRLDALVAEANMLVDYAVERYITGEGMQVAGLCILFSGGNDSTVLAHLMRQRATHAVHANTTIGIEQTRVFVRDVCASWGLPLIEVTPPRVQDHYRTLVLEQGFPGPGHHFKMFQRLKERGLRQARKQLVLKPRRERVVFVAGRRRQESERRANVPEMERVGSTVWVSPMVNWTKLDLSSYRLASGDVPINEVVDLLHMSGECLCGAFAHLNELEEIEEWFADEPQVQMIRELEALIADRSDIPEHRKRWGWGGDPAVLKASRIRSNRSKSGRLCSSCEAR